MTIFRKKNSWTIVIVTIAVTMFCTSCEVRQKRKIESEAARADIVAVKNENNAESTGSTYVVMDGTDDYFMNVITKGTVEMIYPMPWNYDVDDYGKRLCKAIDRWQKRYSIADEISIQYVTDPSKGPKISVDFCLGFYKTTLKLRMGIIPPLEINDVIESLNQLYSYCVHRYHTGKQLKKILRRERVVGLEYDISQKEWKSFDNFYE